MRRKVGGENGWAILNREIAGHYRFRSIQTWPQTWDIYCFNVDMRFDLTPKILFMVESKT